jgi:hypothetical protein
LPVAKQSKILLPALQLINPLERTMKIDQARNHPADPLMTENPTNRSMKLMSKYGFHLIP